MRFRIEKDALGKKKVPSNALFGIHTQRAIENFQISNQTLPLELFHAIAEIKIAAALANNELDYLPKNKTNLIIRASKEILQGKHDSEFVVDAFQAGEGTPTHMNVNEVIANRANVLANRNKGDYSFIHPYDHVNMGQSTNNVVPAAIKIVSLHHISLLLPVLENLKKELLRKSKQFSKITKSGRTHLQDAVPITLGQEFHAYASSIDKNIRLLKTVSADLRILNVGRNAIGTGINTHPSFSKRILRHLRKLNGFSWVLSSDPIYSTSNVTVFLEVSEILKLLSVDLTKLSNDLRLLSSGPNTGFRELILPAVEPGSSIMPGKVNPSMVEMLNMVCFQVMGNDESISLAAQAGQLQLNVMLPLIAKNLIESIKILTNGVDSFTKKCVSGINANKKVCEFYLEHSAGIATLLNPYIGYDAAANLVKESLKTGEKISDIALRKKLVDPKLLKVLLNPKNMTSPNLKVP